MDKKRRIIIFSAAAIVIIVAVVIILYTLKRSKASSETASETQAVIENEIPKSEISEDEKDKVNEETEPIVVVQEETEPEEPVFEYIDAHGIWHETIIDEHAKACQYEPNMLSHDEEGNVAYPVEDVNAENYYDLERGVDVSAHQGEINWYEVRNSKIDYAIIRAAYRGYGEEGKLCTDEMFERNYTEAYKVGLKVGMYVFSQAINEEEAIEEAELVLSLIDDRPLDMFIAYDPENVWETEARIDRIDREQITKNAVAFCETVKAAGYTPAIYSNMIWEAEKFDMAELSEKYEFWYADYETIPQSPYAFSSWQYSESGSISGIEGEVDLNVAMVKPRVESEEEKKIYSYVQIPREYYENSVWVNKKRCNDGWVGDWAHIEAGGQEFGWFGCGICCLSNTVSTLSNQVVPPDEMFYATKDNTGYYPEGGLGAVSWSELKKMCNLYGLTAELKGKPSEYDTFKNDVASSDTTVVVVCQDNDKRLWWYTRGHYVNVWDYDEETGTVFVTDPSSHYNRQRVQLIDVYHALKTANPAQYMNVWK